MDFTLIYKLFTGSKTKFEDKVGTAVADAFWPKLDTVCIFSIIILLFVSIGFCIYYFTEYNNQPGRHYHPKHWCGFYLGTTVMTFILTVAIGYLLAKPTHEATKLIWMTGLGNFVYSILLFGLVSCLWWLCKWPTNAYKLM